MENTAQNLTLVDKPPALSFDVRALENLIKERRNLIVKVNGVYEISRPLALELLKAVRDQVIALGGQMHEDLVFQLDPSQAAVKYQIIIKLPPTPNGNEPAFTVTDVGEASAKEQGKDMALLRTASTRAMKRALEKLVGEDFINRVILSLPEAQASVKEVSSDAPASEKQKALIRKLQSEGKVSTDIDVENLSKSQASEMLDKFFNKKKE